MEERREILAAARARREKRFPGCQCSPIVIQGGRDSVRLDWDTQGCPIHDEEVEADITPELGNVHQYATMPCCGAGPFTLREGEPCPNCGAV